MSSDRVVEEVETCETDGCTRDVYPGESLCLGCYRKATRRSR
ncbi:hypothetical protein OB920_04990 [Halobacteria archaeon HArc-gm2]|nr:hypothetical protein [Halobacteria archaeon HArc-gm2]